MEINSVLSTLFEMGGIGVFIWYLFHGLKIKIEHMQGTIDIQKSTLEAMEQRAKEAEKIGQLYKKLLSDLPEDIEKYKETVSKLKDSVISELEAALDRKDRKAEAIFSEKVKDLEGQEALLRSKIEEAKHSTMMAIINNIK